MTHADDAAPRGADRKAGADLDAREVARLSRLDERVLWLSSWMIHNANALRESRDGVKVGGHQASCASISTIMSALYFGVLRPQDRVAVKPHASPILHAIEHVYGRQSLAAIKDFRAFGGAQSYPSRTKDAIPVDFSTGSVGLGVAVTAFASLAQDYVAARGGLNPDEDAGRMIALLGDAELDEGNIYEALIEAHKYDVRNLWWIVDYNRQSLDAVTPERMFERFDDVFASFGWRVETLKYGARQRAAFARPGGAALRAWIDACPNDLYSALTFEGAQAWRAALEAEFSARSRTRALVDAWSDDELADVMTNLGGHCMATVLEAFRAPRDDRPTFFIPYTVKGYRLAFQGHKDNHGGVMTGDQIATLRARLGVREGEEWDLFSGLSDAETAELRAYVGASAYAKRPAKGARPRAPALALPPLETFDAPGDARQSTQAAFGKILNNLARRDDAFADAIVTMAPDVTVTTNLTAFVNRRGLFAREQERDLFRERKLASPQTWDRGPQGQHVELGIAEMNLFLALAAFGLSHEVFAHRLLPVGTLYDPFVARGLDALNYAAYMDARFIVVGTPSGVTLAPEGGAHQSISSPLIGMGQPGLTYYEPAYADELGAIMAHAFAHMQAPDGGSTYLRLTTRSIAQPVRTDAAWRTGAVEGGYWLVEPRQGAELALVSTGVVTQEARAAHAELADDAPGMGHLVVTSPDRLHAGWTASRSKGARGPSQVASQVASQVERLLAPLSARAGLITVIDGAPSTLSWLGAVRGHRVRALGVEQFGQSGDTIDLYRAHGLDADAILDAAAALYLG